MGGRRGFTLVELLVTVATISLLASLLLPTLQDARARATIAVCMGRERGVGTAFVTFHNDNGRFPNALNTYSRNAQWDWDGLDRYIGIKRASKVYVTSHGTKYYGSYGELDWVFPCGAGTDNAWMIATVPHWCIPVRVECVSDPQWRVHIGCHISRTEKHIKPDWFQRYALLCCNTVYNAPDMQDAYGEHMRKGSPMGSNICFLDGHVVWRPVVGGLTAPHPSVTYMYRDEGNWRNSEGLWVFGYNGWSILLPQEANGFHPDQTNIINRATGWPDSVERPYWMK